jgi:hypothetical protein
MLPSHLSQLHSNDIASLKDFHILDEIGHVQGGTAVDETFIF